MKSNNKGYSLVEILIVIAILAVVTSAGTVSFRLIYNTKVTTSSRTVQTLAKSVRLNNMTKQQLKYIHIIKSDNLNYVYVDENLTADMTNRDEQLGSTDLGIYYGSSTGTLQGIANNSAIAIYFDRSGRCYVYDKSGNLISNVTRIRFSNGTRTSNINISRVTGKVTIE